MENRGPPIGLFAACFSGSCSAPVASTSRILLVALQQLDRDALRAAEEADANAWPDRRWLLGELDALGLDLGGDRIDVLYRQPEMIEPLVGCGGRRVDAVARRYRRDEHVGPAELDVDAPGAADDNPAENVLKPGRGRLRIGAAQVDVIPGDDRHRGLPFVLWTPPAGLWQVGAVGRTACNGGYTAAATKQPLAPPTSHEAGSDTVAPVPGAHPQNGRFGMEKRFALFECNSGAAPSFVLLGPE